MSGVALPREREGAGEDAPGRDARVPPLSILHVAAPGPVGGLETVLDGLTRGLAERGHRVRVLAVIEPREDDHPFVNSIRDSRVEAVPVEVSSRNYLAESLRVARHCRDFSPDVVHTHGFRADVVDALAARSVGCPIATTVHGPSKMGGIATFYEWLQERAFRLFDGIIAVSHALASDLRRQGIDEKRITVIHNAFPGGREFLDRGEARKELGLDDDAFVIGWVGRMIDAKGPDLLIEGLARLEDLDFTASIVGDGPELRRVQGMTRERGLTDSVEFHGRIDDAARLFRAFDVFALSSRTEGTPLVLLEAMAAGVPVVVTGVGGVPEIVGPDEARVVPARQPDSLAQAIADVAAHPKEAGRRADRARAAIEEEFSTDAWIRKHELFYSRCAGKGGGTGRE